MTTTRVTVAGVLATSLVLHVPPVGPWWLDAALDGEPTLEGHVDVQFGDALTLRGTVVPRATGAFGSTVSTRVVGGGAGWSTLLASRAYHSDDGVTARSVASDAASTAGETLGSFAPGAPSIGVDYVRASGTAATALEAAISGAAWWVDFDGNTVVGARQTSTPAAASYQVLEFDPVNRIAAIEADDVSSIVIGSVLAADERLPTSQTVRELRIEVSGEAIRIVAWCGDLDVERGRLARAFETVVRRILAEKIHGSVRYRVMRTSSDRVELQAISPGYPDVGPISYAPGMAGAHATLAIGAEVLVEFVEGNPTLPRVTHFAGKDGVGWTPIDVTIDASGVSASIKLGANASETPAWASKMLAELSKIETALSTAQAPAGTAGGPLLWTPPTNAYVAPSDASSIGAAKTVCE